MKKSPISTSGTSKPGLDNFVGKKRYSWYFWYLNQIVRYERNQTLFSLFLSFFLSHLCDKTQKLFRGIFIIWIFKFLKKLFCEWLSQKHNTEKLIKYFIKWIWVLQDFFANYDWFAGKNLIFSFPSEIYSTLQGFKPTSVLKLGIKLDSNIGFANYSQQYPSNDQFINTKFI